MKPSDEQTVPIDTAEDRFRSEVLKSKQPVVVQFWAPWSRPCEAFARVVEEVASALTGKAKVVKVNADDHPDLSLWYNIQSVPTLLCFWGGEPRLRIVGAVGKKEVMAKLQPFLCAAGTANW